MPDFIRHTRILIKMLVFGQNSNQARNRDLCNHDFGFSISSFDSTYVPVIWKLPWRWTSNWDPDLPKFDIYYWMVVKWQFYVKWDIKSKKMWKRELNLSLPLSSVHTFHFQYHPDFWRVQNLRFCSNDCGQPECYELPDHDGLSGKRNKTGLKPVSRLPDIYRRLSRRKQLGGLVLVFRLGVPLRYKAYLHEN